MPHNDEPRLVADEDCRAYWDLFVNRKAHGIQRTTPDDSGKYSYVRAGTYRDPITGQPREPENLTLETIGRHVRGELTFNLYAINPQNQRAKWFAVDGDYDEAVDHLCRLDLELRKLGLTPVSEQSRRGMHLWLFCATPQLAKDGRDFLRQVCRDAALPVQREIDATTGRSLRKGLELFPAQDCLSEEVIFGNAIRAPLGKHRATNSFYHFYEARSYTIRDQLALCHDRRTLTDDMLASLLTRVGRPASPPEPEPISAPRPWTESCGRQKPFHIFDHLPRHLFKKQGRNWVGQCPSCAEDGHDKHGDNLHVKVGEEHKYVCRKGCTKEEIRRVLGCPILYSHAHA